MYFGEIQPATTRTITSPEHPTQYQFQHVKRGYALLVYNENPVVGTRTGQLAAIEDFKMFKEMLEQQFHFEVDLEILEGPHEMYRSVRKGKSVSCYYYCVEYANYLYTTKYK